MVAHTIIPLGAVFSHRAVLRLYAALNPLQRARLQTTGVPVGELNGVQRELMATWKPAAATEGAARLALYCESEAVVFSLTVGAATPQEEHVSLERGKAFASG